MSRDSEGCCPGEAACKDFQRAAPPKINACRLCPLLPTKPVQIQSGFEDVVLRIERLWQERRAGRIISPTQLAPLEWEGLIIWDELEEQYRYAHEDRVARAVEIAAALMQAQV